MENRRRMHGEKPLQLLRWVDESARDWEKEKEVRIEMLIVE